MKPKKAYEALPIEVMLDDLEGLRNLDETAACVKKILREYFSNVRGDPEIRSDIEARMDENPLLRVLMDHMHRFMNEIDAAREERDQAEKRAASAEKDAVYKWQQENLVKARKRADELGIDFRGKALEANIKRGNETLQRVESFILKYRSQGISGVREITRKLNQEGVPSPRGGTWSPGTISRILKKL